MAAFQSSGLFSQASNLVLKLPEAKDPLINNNRVDMIQDILNILGDSKPVLLSDLSKLLPSDSETVQLINQGIDYLTIFATVLAIMVFLLLFVSRDFCIALVPLLFVLLIFIFTQDKPSSLVSPNKSLPVPPRLEKVAAAVGTNFIADALNNPIPNPIIEGFLPGVKIPDSFNLFGLYNILLPDCPTTINTLYALIKSTSVLEGGLKGNIEDSLSSVSEILILFIFAILFFLLWIFAALSGFGKFEIILTYIVSIILFFFLYSFFKEYVERTFQKPLKLSTKDIKQSLKMYSELMNQARSQRSNCAAE